MARKAWVFTSQDDKIVDVFSARKKIAQVDTHICDLYAQLFGGDYAELKSLVMHPSGQEVVLEKAPNTLRAKLGEVDDATWSKFEKSDNAGW